MNWAAYEQVLNWISLLAFASFAYPMWRVWRVLRTTSLRHAVGWMFLAWIGWLAAMAMPLMELPVRPVRYIALCLSACVFVAVLGARKPGMAAWNFVVFGLLAVLALPLIQQAWADAGWGIDTAWAMLLGVIIVLAALNYLSPPLGVVVFFISTAWLGVWLVDAAVWKRAEIEAGQVFRVLGLVVAANVWLGLRMALGHVQNGRAFQALWKRFRVCYGLVWGKRVQEQFNAAAKNAGWHVRLEWIKGLQPEPGHPPPTAKEEAAMLQTLQAVLKPFGVGEEEKTPTA